MRGIKITIRKNIDALLLYFVSINPENRLFSIISTIVIFFTVFITVDPNIVYPQEKEYEIRSDNEVLNDTYSASYQEKSVAIVTPIFTVAAYNDSFYNFFREYAQIPRNETVKYNLHYLSSDITIPKSDHKYSAGTYMPLKFINEHIKNSFNNITLNVITDLDVHKGDIFYNNGSNKFDLLILVHNEYVTQQEYDNFRKYVSNGGVLLLLFSNTFFAEVGYDPLDHKITLIKGHRWEFNGTAAWKSVWERWFDENSKWVGSNYLCANECSIEFHNNPFGYIHKEDSFITNENATILIDYNASIISHKNPETILKYKIGLHDLEFEKGKVISFNIYPTEVINNQDFLNIFDKLLLSNLDLNTK